uniref:CDKN2A interacting protein N-terminal like n=1 Tax=Oryzias latipes TaxID=8090 RepID=A0A3P9LJM3_ORYLA
MTPEEDEIPFRWVLIDLLWSRMSSADVEDFIQQNRDEAERVETFRGYWESWKHWEPRREFILRNMSDFESGQVDHLLSLSMVWANNVFLGCRYSSELLERVKAMAEGIVVDEAPIFKTRDEIMKNQPVLPSTDITASKPWSPLDFLWFSIKSKKKTGLRVNS